MELNSSPSQSGSKIEDAAELLKLLCIADANASTYPLKHPLVHQSVQQAYEWLAQMIEVKNGPIDINMTEDTILFEGLRAETRNSRVAHFSKKLTKIHANDLKFTPGIELEELFDFYSILMFTEDQIENEGGVKAILEKSTITHIAISESKFVLVEDDEQVISRGAHITQGSEEDNDADEELAKYLISKIKSGAKNGHWILNEMKNHPKRAVPLMIKAIEQSIKDPSAMTGEKETIESLLKNIELVGESLIDHDNSDSEDVALDDQQALTNKVLNLEKEIQARSKGLVSSEASDHFLSELLDVVQTYANQMKATNVSKEFLKGEKSLKKTEHLLKNIKSDEVITEEVAALLQEEGQSEPQEPKKAPKRPKRKKTFDQALHDGIEQRIKKISGGNKETQDAVDRLTTFFTNKISEKDKIHHKEVHELQTTVAKHDHIIDALNHGVLIWDSEGTVEYIDQRAEDILHLKQGAIISHETLVRLEEMSFPLPFPSEIDSEQLNNKDEVFLLYSIQTLIPNEAGVPTGALLKESTSMGL